MADFRADALFVCYCKRMDFRSDNGEPVNPGEVTQILDDIGAGRVAADVLLPLVYRELRGLAAARMANEAAGQTLQPTALVHEAYLRLTGGSTRQWDSRGHFFAAAAEAMRRILVENARRKGRQRHGGGRDRVALQDDAAADPPVDHHDLLALDEALLAFADEAPEKAKLVKLRYFAGLSEDQAADLLGISRATAARWWAFSRAWLLDRMRS